MKMNRPLMIKLREHFRWSQKDAAKASGISTQAYSRAECGYGIHRRTADRIIESFRRKLREMERRPLAPLEEVREDLERLERASDDGVTAATIDAVAVGDEF